MEKNDINELDLEPIDYWTRVDDDIMFCNGWIGNAFSVVDETGKVIGVSGLSVDSEGIGTGWLIGSAALRSRPLFLHRMVKRLCKHIINDSEVRQLRVTVDPKSDVAIRWVERLGFELDRKSNMGARYVMEKQWQNPKQ